MLKAKMGGVAPLNASLRLGSDVQSKWLGEWQVGRSYAPLDKVSRDGSSFVCVRSCTAVDPLVDVGDGVEGQYWILIAKHGADGKAFTYDMFTEEQLEALRGPAGVGEPGQPGLPGKDGKPGFSPVVTVTKIANGHRVAITDANGTKTFDVMDGEDGEGGGGGSGENGTTFYPYVDENGNLSWTNDGGLENPETVNIKGPEGKPGQNGYSPVVTVAAISGGHRVTVTDKSGTKTFDVMDGGDGAPGKTPVKGTDYWTAADKQEIIEDLKDEGVGGATVLTATIGTSWTDNDDGTKSQTVSLSGVTAANNAQVDAYYNGGEYADFVEAQNQFLEFITNGFAKTVAGGITFTIFGESNTVSIPIIVEVV